MVNISLSDSLVKMSSLRASPPSSSRTAADSPPSAINASAASPYLAHFGGWEYLKTFSGGGLTNRGDNGHLYLAHFRVLFAQHGQLKIRGQLPQSACTYEHPFPERREVLPNIESEKVHVEVQRRQTAINQNAKNGVINTTRPVCSTAFARMSQ